MMKHRNNKTNMDISDKFILPSENTLYMAHCDLLYTLKHITQIAMKNKLEWLYSLTNAVATLNAYDPEKVNTNCTELQQVFISDMHAAVEDCKKSDNFTAADFEKHIDFVNVLMNEKLFEKLRNVLTRYTSELNHKYSLSYAELHGAMKSEAALKDAHIRFPTVIADTFVNAINTYTKIVKLSIKPFPAEAQQDIMLPETRTGGFICTLQS